jgi:hypothetical protein
MCQRKESTKAQCNDSLQKLKLARVAGFGWATKTKKDMESLATGMPIDSVTRYLRVRYLRS